MKKKEKLTYMEQQMFDMLYDNPTVAREDLATLRRKPIAYISNAVDVHMKNLRKKIQRDGFEIITIRGFGYKLKKV